MLMRWMRCRSKNRWSMVFSLIWAVVIRLFLVIISYGCKVPAGIFVPSMAIGAAFGRMVGILVQALHEAMPDSRFFAACQPDVPVCVPNCGPEEEEGLMVVMG